MSAFAEFIKGACVVAISGGLAMLISPEGKIKRYVKLIISLCMVSALLAPLMSLSSELEGYIDNIKLESADKAQSDYAAAEAMVTATARENIETELKELIHAEFGFKEDEVYIVVTIDSEDISALKITDITVFLSDTQKSEEIERRLSELFLNTANIHIIKKGAKE